ncbi:MAG TPA: DEAD/DEAH box helicase family protein, partial [Patescibacteria group bacterium]
MITERAAERVEVSPKSVKEARIEQSIASLISFVEEQLPSQNHFRIGQREAFGEIAKFLKSGNRKGYILHPTGYGKTLVLNQTGEVVNPTKEVIITPLVDGLFQLKEERQKLNPNREIGLVYAESKEFDKPIVIITINSFMALVNRVNKGDLSWRDNLINLVNAELVFLDEAHRYLTKKRIAALKLFALQGHGESILIGATATDFYSRNKNLELLFGPKIHEVSTMDAIEEGALVSARGVMVKVDLSLDKIGTIETK